MKRPRRFGVAPDQRKVAPALTSRRVELLGQQAGELATQGVAALVGRVVATDPAPGGQVLDGGTVTVTISLGKERYDIPKLKGMTEDLKTELGPEMADLDLRSLHPKEFVRKHLLEDDPDEMSYTPRQQTTLLPGEPAPWDPDTT